MPVPKASFRSGAPVMVDYTAAANLLAGDVVLVGNTVGWTCGVAHKDIANTEKGSLAAGGGVYAVKIATANVIGTKLYWDTANSVLTTTSTNFSTFGFQVEATTAVNTVALVLHKPYV